MAVYAGCYSSEPRTCSFIGRYNVTVTTMNGCGWSGVRPKANETTTPIVSSENCRKLWSTGSLDDVCT